MTDTTANIPIKFILIGAVIGGAIGCYLFWPSFFGGVLPMDEVQRIWAQGGGDFDAFITPWLIKSAVCTVIGAVAGFVISKFMTRSQP